MNVKFLQFNIWRSTFIHKIIEYIKKNDFDIIHLQEVTGGQFSNGGAYSFKQENLSTRPVNLKAIGIDGYEILKKTLPYQSHFIKTLGIINDPPSYFANVTLHKPSFKVLEKHIIWFCPYIEIPDVSHENPAKSSRAAIALKLEKEGKQFWTINTHLVRGSNSGDENFKLAQAKRLYDFIKKLDLPFVLSGDFNVTPDTDIVQMFNNLARNLTVEYKITNTLNPDIHYAKHLFPKGIAVDFVFVEKSIKVQKFKLVDQPGLSDHYGFMLEFSI